MEKISNIKFEEITSSTYIRPVRMYFTQDDNERKWDMMLKHDSVAGLLYHTEKRALIFVQQFRPAVYVNRVADRESDLNAINWCEHSGSLGLTYELCAGIVDKDLPLKEIMHAEYLEECGFNIPLDNIQKVTSFRSGIGVSSSSETIFYAECDDSMKVSEGGGNPNENELINVVYIPIEKAKDMGFDESINKPSGLLFAILWFYDKIAHKYINN